MEIPLSLVFFFISFFASWCCIFATVPACHNTCGSVDIKYPFGTGYGCGSPRFYPYVTCPQDKLLLTTHTGSYPITSISYTTSTLTISPSSMSTCNSMQQSPNLGLDWSSPFQLGPSTFLLLSCTPSISSFTIGSFPVCDLSSSHLCDSFYTCPSVVGLGLSLFPPSNTCCVYSPANFNTKGELDLRVLKCRGYSSIVSLEDFPTDPNRWLYGVSLKYTHGAFDNYDIDNKCNTCEESGGVCGFSPPSDSFICVCENGFNTTTQCSNFNIDYQDDQVIFGSSGLSSTWKSWLGILGGMILYM